MHACGKLVCSCSKWEARLRSDGLHLCERMCVCARAQVWKDTEKMSRGVMLSDSGYFSTVFFKVL